MHCIEYFAALWTLVCTILQIRANYQCGIRKHSFIPLVHHGWKVEDGQWPWHVALFYRSPNATTYACGGTLIDSSHVLTAAHCVVDRRTSHPLATDSLLLHFGVKNLSKTEQYTQIRDVSVIHVHPEYAMHRNDIAVLELRLPVEYSDFVIPICLDTRVDRDLASLEHQRGWITGWGMTQNGSVSRGELQTASLPVVSYLQCVRNDPLLFGNLINEKVFCAGDRNGTSPGTGDSGGGMYFSDGDRWVLRGIVSFAKIDASRLRVDTSKYAIFVNVQRYLTWIREVTMDRNATLVNGGIARRISEIECDRFQKLARKRSNGVCSNARYPHTVTLVYTDDKERCTGILLNENHVLAACHCHIYNSTVKASKVRISEHGLISISNFTCHPGSSLKTRHHDLAVVKLSSSIDLSYNTVPACLASNWTENLYDTLLLTGFARSELGLLQFFESDANQLITQDDCNRQLARLSTRTLSITPAQLCAVNNDRILASSQGSSGAPLQTVNTRSCTFTVVGVLSFGTRNFFKGDRAANDTSLDVFARVAYYLDWIEETVWGENVGAVRQTTAMTVEALEALKQVTTEKVASRNDFVFPTD